MKRHSFFLLLVAAALAARHVPAVPVKVVFDTDMMGDYDDVGALAMLHAMADAGECEILATVASTRSDSARKEPCRAVAVIETVNAYYGRADLPVGAPKAATAVRGGPTRRFYGLWPAWCADAKYPDAEQAPDAVAVYRRALAAQPDKSVVICTTGFLTNLRGLLESPADAVSPLDGRTLVAKKVSRLVAMACDWPRGRECNAQGDGASTKYVCENWPGPIFFSDFRLGCDLYTGRAVAEASFDRPNPVQTAFKNCLTPREKVVKGKSWDQMDGHPSWDETAVLVAVRGNPRYFDAVRGRQEILDATGANVWHDDPKGPHFRLIEKKNWQKKLQVGRVIDELMCRPPRFDPQGELLYNGIRLPKEWPPKLDRGYKGPMKVPYLERPPEAVTIDTGRQLFVDDFLVERLDGLVRTFHHPVKYAGNPVLKPETPWELNRPGLAVALPKGGGLWWDANRGVFRLWYEAGWCGKVCYAESRDGLVWERPQLDVVPGTNRVLPVGFEVDSWSVVPDPDSVDPNARWKLFVNAGGVEDPSWVLGSPDGIHWTKRQRAGQAGDRSTMFYNPFRRKWVFSLRGGGTGFGRSRSYREADDFFRDCHWGWFVNGADPASNAYAWLGTDTEDIKDPTVCNQQPELYSFDAVAYESLMLGVYELHEGPQNEVCDKAKMPKITDLVFAYSRDGFHWSRPDRTAAIRSERWKSGAWDAGYVQPLSNLCVVKGDELWFYYGGFAGTSPDGRHRGMYEWGSMGLAKLRRDGFASLDAAGTGRVLTRPIVFTGEHLFVNAAAAGVTAELLDEKGAVLAVTRPVAGDHVKTRLDWTTPGALASVRGRRVRFRFTVEKGALYAFWVTGDPAGASRGYLAGGGPGYRGLRDL